MKDVSVQPHNSGVNILVGTVLHRQGAYILDRYLANQAEIQSFYPSSRLIIAVNEVDFAAELRSLLELRQIKGSIIEFNVTKPDHAQSRIWNICAGREALRTYMLNSTSVNYLLFLDSDMTFDPQVISTMEQHLRGYDAIFSGYYFRNYGLGFAGAGCLMLTRAILQKIKFRCYEFKNGEVIFEDNLIEMDVVQNGGRIKKGVFVATDHYTSADKFVHTAPQKMSSFQKITNHPLLRYLLIKFSIIARFNFTWHIKVWLSKHPPE